MKCHTKNSIKCLWMQCQMGRSSLSCTQIFCYKPFPHKLFSCSVVPVLLHTAMPESKMLLFLFFQMVAVLTRHWNYGSALSQMAVFGRVIRKQHMNIPVGPPMSLCTFTLTFVQLCGHIKGFIKWLGPGGWIMDWSPVKWVWIRSAWLFGVFGLL